MAGQPADRSIRPLSGGAAVATGLLAAGLTILAGWRSRDPATLPANVLLAAGSALLAVIDVRERRLPNPLVLATLVGEAVLLLPVAAASDRWSALARAPAAAAAVFGGLLLTAVIAPSAIGMGDVKLGAVVGLALGFRGWHQVLSGLLVAFALQGALTVVLLAVGKADRRSGIAFGPALLAGTWIALIASA